MKTYEVKLKIVTDGNFCGGEGWDKSGYCEFLHTLGKNEEFECFKYGKLEKDIDDDDWYRPVRCLECLEEFK